MFQGKDVFEFTLSPIILHTTLYHTIIYCIGLYYIKTINVRYIY